MIFEPKKIEQFCRASPDYSGLNLALPSQMYVYGIY